MIINNYSNFKKFNVSIMNKMLKCQFSLKNKKKIMRMIKNKNKLYRLNYKILINKKLELKCTISMKKLLKE